MEPKLKAKELVEKMQKSLFSDGAYDAKQCALIAVEVALEDATQNTVKHGRGGLTNYDYWNEVKTEIESL